MQNVIFFPDFLSKVIKTYTFMLNSSDLLKQIITETVMSHSP
jgi:hypothetical protein